MLERNEVIYHYCSIESMLSIIKTKTLWLSHATTTNDSMEGKVLTSLMDKIHREGKIKSNKSGEILKTLTNDVLPRLQLPFISCFSRNPDLLSQWRAYGDDGKGACIGFDLSKLSHRDLMNEKFGPDDALVYIDEVTYGSGDDESFALRIPSIAKILIEKKGVEQKKALEMVGQMVQLLSIYEKTPGFKEEDEIRMACYPWMSGSTKKMRPQFRSIDSRIVPYIEYPLPVDCICEVVLGPKCKTDLKQLEWFLRNKAKRIVQNNKHRKSELTYR